jgi:hypothetical protein
VASAARIGTASTIAESTGTAAQRRSSPAQWFAGNTYEHYAEQGDNIQRWLATTATTTAADGYA